jgi:hypothetical protein
MKVVLFFSNEHNRGPETVRHVMYGMYSEAGFLFVHDTYLECFWTSAGKTYRRKVWSVETISMWEESDTDFLLLSVNEEEKQKLWATCDACVQARKPFNLIDLLLMYVPFREVEDLPVVSAPTLNNAQAIIVILRECLDANNSLRQAMADLNSRETFIENLYNRLRPYSLPVFWASLTAVVNFQPVCKALEKDLTT